MKREWSENQLQVINANDDTILVSASAGSGKTTVMIERVLRLLESGIKIANMLICTFTKAAAADMRAKLYAEMSKRGLRSELKDLSRADISTIDSFCQRIVTKYFYVIGVDPQFDVLDEAESISLKAEAIDKSIEKFKDDADFCTLCSFLRKKRRNETVKKALLSIMEFISINPDTVPSYSYDYADAASKIADYIQVEKAKTLAAIENLFYEIDEPEIKAEFISALNSGNCVWERRKLKKENSQYKPCVDYLKDRVEIFVQSKNEIAELKPQSSSQTLIEALIKTAKFAYQTYSEEKLKRASVDFADLEIMTLRILESDAADEIREKYKYVFVDEYQDINPLQENLIRRVSLGNKLFMVGDLKQSIYAFRGCAPQIFKQKYDSFKQGNGGRVINLDTNYRSSKGIVDFVNKVFGSVMTENFGGVDYKSNPMSAFKSDDGYVKLHIVTGKERKPSISGVYSVKEHKDEDFMSKTEAEATLIAIRVQELLNKSGDAPVKFGDIAILTRSMGTLESLVVSKLRQINVPVSLKEDAFYLSRPETGQLISFLRLIDNRLDDKTMAISMLSPFGNFSENELGKIRLSGDGPFHKCVMAAAATDDKVKAFIDKLDRYYSLSLTLNVDELADMIVSECGYFNYAFRLGEDAAEVLDKFLEFLGSCPYKSSLKACLNFIDVHNPYTELTGDENSVKLMTIHKSKGLQFKYVFVIGLNEPFNLRDLNKQIIVDSAISMCVYEDHKAYCSDLLYLAKLRERKKQLEEELRIFYVALTRAEEGLELFATMSDSEKIIPAYQAQPNEVVDFSECTSALKWLAPCVFLANKYDIDDIKIEEAPTHKVLFGRANEKLTKELKSYFEFLPPTNAPTKSYVSKLAHNDDEPAVFIVAEPTDGNALERGNAYHRAMEKIDFSAPDLSLISADDLKLVDADKILAAAKHMNKFVGQIYKEKPFMIKLTSNEAGTEGNGNVLVQGVIDLLIINGDQATVVDYKTGKPHGSYEQGYFKQVGLYALAVERLLAKKVTGKFLYYFDWEEFVEIT